MEATYLVQAVVTRELNGWRSSVQLPIFWVDAASISEATRKARMIADAHVDRDCVSLAILNVQTGEYQSTVHE